jgi:hypothetical protein
VLLAYRHPETDSAGRLMKCRFIGQIFDFREMKEVIVPEGGSRSIERGASHN